MKNRIPSQRRRNFAYPIVLLVLLILIVFLVAKPQVLQQVGHIIKNNLYLSTTQATGAIPPSSSAKRFTTLPPGAKLPSEAECAARVRRSAWEPRSDNYVANNSTPTAQQIAALTPWNESIGVSPQANVLLKQITGHFTGTTDEILQWVACKWGIDEDIVRAEAAFESNWHQSQTSDWSTDPQMCPPGTWDGSGCWQSYGILQIKYFYFKSSWPMSRDDAAFSAEYVYGIIRTCYEGWTTYLAEGTPLPGYPAYHAGDIWGCLGRWYSGWWYTQDAITYINGVKTHLANKEWQQPLFAIARTTDVLL